jgi:hypothetical protein
MGKLGVGGRRFLGAFRDARRDYFVEIRQMRMVRFCRFATGKPIAMAW